MPGEVLQELAKKSAEWEETKIEFSDIESALKEWFFDKEENIKTITTELTDTNITTLETELRDCLVSAYQDIHTKTEKTDQDNSILLLITKLKIEMPSEEFLEKYDNYINNIHSLLGTDEHLNKKEINIQLAKIITTIDVNALDISMLDDMDVDENGIYVQWINAQKEEKKNYIFSLENISKNSKIFENKEYLLNNIRLLFKEYFVLYPKTQRRGTAKASFDNLWGDIVWEKDVRKIDKVLNTEENRRAFIDGTLDITALEEKCKLDLWKDFNKEKFAKALRYLVGVVVNNDKVALTNIYAKWKSTGKCYAFLEKKYASINVSTALPAYSSLWVYVMLYLWCMKEKLKNYTTTITASTGESALMITEVYTDLTKIQDAGVKSIIINTEFGKKMLEQSKEYYKQKNIEGVYTTFQNKIPWIQKSYNKALDGYKKEENEFRKSQEWAPGFLQSLTEANQFRRGVTPQEVHRAQMNTFDVMNFQPVYKEATIAFLDLLKWLSEKVVLEPVSVAGDTYYKLLTNGWSSDQLAKVSPKNNRTDWISPMMEWYLLAYKNGKKVNSPALIGGWTFPLDFSKKAEWNESIIIDSFWEEFKATISNMLKKWNEWKYGEFFVDIGKIVVWGIAAWAMMIITKNAFATGAAFMAWEYVFWALWYGTMALTEWKDVGNAMGDAVGMYKEVLDDQGNIHKETKWFWEFVGEKAFEYWSAVMLMWPIGRAWWLVNKWIIDVTESKILWYAWWLIAEAGVFTSFNMGYSPLQAWWMMTIETWSLTKWFDVAMNTFQTSLTPSSIAANFVYNVWFIIALRWGNKIAELIPGVKWLQLLTQKKIMEKEVVKYRQILDKVTAEITINWIKMEKGENNTTRFLDKDWKEVDFLDKKHTTLNVLFKELNTKALDIWLQQKNINTVTEEILKDDAIKTYLKFINDNKLVSSVLPPEEILVKRIEESKTPKEKEDLQKKLEEYKKLKWKYDMKNISTEKTGEKDEKEAWSKTIVTEGKEKMKEGVEEKNITKEEYQKIIEEQNSIMIKEEKVIVDEIQENKNDANKIRSIIAKLTNKVTTVSINLANTVKSNELLIVKIKAFVNAISHVTILHHIIEQVKTMETNSRVMYTSIKKWERYILSGAWAELMITLWMFVVITGKHINHIIHGDMVSALQINDWFSLATEAVKNMSKNINSAFEIMQTQKLACSELKNLWNIESGEAFKQKKMILANYRKQANSLTVNLDNTQYIRVFEKFILEQKYTMKVNDQTEIQDIFRYVIDKMAKSTSIEEFDKHRSNIYELAKIIDPKQNLHRNIYIIAKKSIIWKWLPYNYDSNVAAEGYTWFKQRSSLTE